MVTAVVRERSRIHRRLLVEELEPRVAPATIFVDASAGSEGDGQSWATAYDDLQSALLDPSLQAGDEIWVADGTYKPTSGASRTATFQLVGDVGLYGGFAGGETELSQRDWTTNIAVLSGDIGTQGVATDNSYHVVTGVDGATLDGFTITAGNANGSGLDGFGAGMYNSSASPTVSNTVFTQNRGKYAGGMFNYKSSSPTITNTVFSANTVTICGGGMYNHTSSSPTLTNVVFVENQANSWGGGMVNSGQSSPVVMNATFSGNVAGGGGAISNLNSSSATVTNSILWGDYTKTTGNEIANDATSSATVTYSNIEGGWGGAGNIDSDPLFFNASDPDGADNIFGTVDDGLRQQGQSPVIDTGTNTGAPPDDITGAARPIGVSTDMGAYEVRRILFYVDADAAGANTGASWTNAFTDLQDALAAAATGGEIWVADGTYTPGSLRADTFQMVSGVGIYGGFDGTETLRDQRDWTVNVTTLNGDIGTPGDSSDNSYHVVTGANSGAVLDGFTITGGNANGSSAQLQHVGGGMYNNGVSPTVANVVFSQNTAMYGGGMFNYTASPTIANTVFSENTSPVCGGGMYNYISSSPTLTNVVFVENRANSWGGGMANARQSNPVLMSATFSENVAGRGGAIGNLLSSSPTLTNSVLWGDTGKSADPEIANDATSSATVTYSNIEGGWGGAGNIDSDPLFANAADPAGADGAFGTNDDGLLLQLGSLSLDSGTATGAPADDIRGTSRPQHGGFDMGAYELEVTATVLNPGDSYEFTDSDGDTVTVTYDIASTGTVTLQLLANGLGADISVTTYVGATASSDLDISITTAVGNGATTAGNVVATGQVFGSFSVEGWIGSWTGGELAAGETLSTVSGGSFGNVGTLSLENDLAGTLEIGNSITASLGIAGDVAGTGAVDATAGTITGLTVGGTVFGVVETNILDGVEFAWQEGASAYKDNSILLTGSDGVVTIDGSLGLSPTSGDEALVDLYVNQHAASLVARNVDFNNITAPGGIDVIDIACQVVGTVSVGSFSNGQVAKIHGNLNNFVVTSGNMSGRLEVNGGGNVTGSISTAGGSIDGEIEITGSLQGSIEAHVSENGAVIYNEAEVGTAHTNDTRAMAEDITDDSLRQIFGTVADSTDQDYYTFNIAASNRKVMFVCNSTEFEPLLTLYDSSGNILSASADHKNGAAVLGYKFGTTGDYFIRVTDDVGTGTGDYKLVITPTPVDISGSIVIWQDIGTDGSIMPEGGLPGGLTIVQDMNGHIYVPIEMSGNINIDRDIGEGATVAVGVLPSQGNITVTGNNDGTIGVIDSEGGTITITGANNGVAGDRFVLFADVDYNTLTYNYTGTDRIISIQDLGVPAGEATGAYAFIDVDSTTERASLDIHGHLDGLTSTDVTFVNIISDSTIDMADLTKSADTTAVLGTVELAAFEAGDTFTVGGDVADFIVSAGDFAGALTVQGDLGGASVTSNPDADPVYAWTQAFGGAADDSGCGVVGVVWDSASSSVYLACTFTGTVDFDPGPGVDNHTATGTWGGYLSKFSEDGTWLWTKTITGPDRVSIHAASTDSSGNIFLTGYFNNTVNFNTDGGTDNHTAISNTEIFLTKLNADGSYAWTQTFAGTPGTEGSNGHDITIDVAGDIYLTGEFAYTVDFDPSAGVDLHTSDSGAVRDVFVTKISADGSYGWTKTFGGTGKDDARQIEMDADGNLLVAGCFETTVDFDPGAGTENRTAGGNADIFVLKLTGSGDYAWVYTAGSTGEDKAWGIDLDDAGNAYAGGWFSGTVDFDPGAGTDNRTSLASFDMFVTRINSDGSYAWTANLEGGSLDFLYDVAVVSDSRVVVSGAFEGTVDLDPTDGTDSRTSSGGAAGFVTWLDQSTLYNGNTPSYVQSAVFDAGGNDAGNNLSVDDTGSVFMTTRFQGTVDFDPGTGTDEHTSSGWRDVALTRFDPLASLTGTITAQGDLVGAIQIPGNITESGEINIFGDVTSTGTIEVQGNILENPGQAWVEMPTGSATGGGISNNASFSDAPVVAVDNQGRPIVAWPDDADGNFEVYVLRWDGASWVEMGTGSASGGGISNNAGASRNVTMAVGLDGNPIVAWGDSTSGNNEIYVRRWDGASWVEMGTGSASGGGISNNAGDSIAPKLAIGGDGNPIVVWTDSSDGDQEIYVRRWDGISWAEIGEGSATGGGISNDTIQSVYTAITVGLDGNPIITWYTTFPGGEEIYLRRWNGVSWEELGGSASGGGVSNTGGTFARDPDIGVDGSGNVIVTWVDASPGNYEIFVRRWNGSSWETIQNVSNNSGSSQSPQMTVGSDGNPIVTWHDYTDGDAENYIRRWNGSAWVEMGASSASGGGISNNSGASATADLAVNAQGQVFAVWRDNSNGNFEIYLRRWEPPVASIAVHGDVLTDTANHAVAINVVGDLASLIEIDGQHTGSAPIKVGSMSATGSLVASLFGDVEIMGDFLGTIGDPGTSDGTGTLLLHSLGNTINGQVYRQTPGPGYVNVTGEDLVFGGAFDSIDDLDV